MSAIESKTFDQPDEQRTPDKTRLDVVNLGGLELGRLRLEPGWRWSDCIKPVAGTESCQAEHVGFLEAGTMTVHHDDGTEATVTAGAVYRIEPGHDAWVVGDEAVVAYEFKSAGTYAKG